jgi:hypothetical protein
MTESNRKNCRNRSKIDTLNLLNTIILIYTTAHMVQKLLKKGEVLLTIGYTIFGNKSYAYIHSQISFHRKHEIIEQSGIQKQNKNYFNKKFANL